MRSAIRKKPNSTFANRKFISGISLYFKALSFLVLLLNISTSYAERKIRKDTLPANINPIFRDSVLKNKIDSAQFHQLKTQTDIYKKSASIPIIQEIKATAIHIYYFAALITLLLLLLLVRLFFEDFFMSLIEGIISNKKFVIYLKSKKYDSFLAMVAVYSLHLLCLAYLLFLFDTYYSKNGYHTFDIYYLGKITLVIVDIFTLKFVVEFIFNAITGTNDAFKTFFIQSLFIELALYFILILVATFLIYYTFISLHIFVWVMAAILLFAMFFNIIRSFQLLGEVKMVYKLHFFLYLCAFKLLPILLLGKYVLNYLAA